ncbi:MAG: thiamine phosphate synthase [Thermodesulfovibrio sp.]|nr:thiamine phosphate synthase [Thermodesulfovibrio sp.]MCX7724718.1 thiamine phosphate synthase [Thermodesulfovibrio sp.]MDW7971909.1 thiamine phosphate synthase [Thermodesulfovibrio sp.]
MKDYKLPSICLIVSTREIPEKLEMALKSGIRWIQYREKDLSRREILDYAFKTRKITKQYDALLTINDYVDIAIAVQADGVHLGQDDLPIEAAKRIFPGIIGISTHNLDEAIEAQKKGANYIGFGPIFHTTTKKDALNPIGYDILSFVCKELEIPVLAIGGIKKQHLQDLKKIGCKYLAVSSGILSGEVKRNVEDFLKFFQ